MVVISLFLITKSQDYFQLQKVKSKTTSTLELIVLNIVLFLLLKWTENRWSFYIYNITSKDMNINLPDRVGQKEEGLSWTNEEFRGKMQRKLKLMNAKPTEQHLLLHGLGLYALEKLLVFQTLSHYISHTLFLDSPTTMSLLDVHRIFSGCKQKQNLSASSITLTSKHIAQEHEQTWSGLFLAL